MLMTDKECYRLFQYGIEGKEYIIKDGVAQQPDTYDPKKDAGGFAGWAFRTDALNVPYASEDPRRYTLNAKWEKTAIDNPYVGFSFDSTNVSSELSAIANVDSQLGIQLMLGKTTEDPHKALKKYREQLKIAGIDTVLAEVKKQYAEWKNGK
jgi:putative aldouronate transport system substrate-binding protein